MRRKPTKERLQVGVRFVVRQGLAHGKAEPGPRLAQDLIEELGHACRGAKAACPDLKAPGNRSTHGSVSVHRERRKECEVVGSAGVSCDADGGNSVHRFAPQ